MATWHKVVHMLPEPQPRACGTWRSAWYALRRIVLPRTPKQDVISLPAEDKGYRAGGTATPLERQGQSYGQVLCAGLKVYWPD